MGVSTQVVWDEALLGYDMGDEHPMKPVRLALTVKLATSLGVLDGVRTLTPLPAADELIEVLRSYSR